MYGWGHGGGWGRGQGRGYGRGMGRRGWGAGEGIFTPPQPIPMKYPNALRVAVPTNEGIGLNSTVSQAFARAPYITLVDILGGKVVNVQSVGNPGVSAGRGVGAIIAKWLIDSGVKVVLAPSLGPHASAVLGQAGVRVYNVMPGIRVIDALRQLRLVTT